MPLAPDYDAWLTLRLTPDVGRMRFHRLVEAFGSPEAALGASHEAILRAPGMDRTAALNVARAAKLVDIAREKALMAEHGVRLVALHDADFPVNLRHSFLPPPLLYVRGTLEADDRFAIAIVGSRVSSPYGRSMTRQIAGELAAAGMTVVSGMAVGIDAAAHEAALEAGGRTLAALANGLARCYPAEHRALREEIVAHGAIFSEYPMEERPARGNFPERNRIIAALALGTLVAEAPARSGALLTADMTLEENRALYALPADATRKTAAGTNALIRSGAARLAASGRDILEDLRGQLRGLLDESGAAEPQARPAMNLEGDEAVIYASLDNGPASLEDLLGRMKGSDYSLGRLSKALLGLEMKRAVKQMPGKIFARIE